MSSFIPIIIRPHFSSSSLCRRAGLCFLLACTAPWRAQADFSLSLAVPTARWPDVVEGQFTSLMADPDGDGLVNFLGYALKTPLRQPSTLANADPRLVRENAAAWLLVMPYRTWANVQAAWVRYQPEAFIDGAWKTSGFVHEPDPDAPVIPGSTARRVRIPIRFPVQPLKESSELLRLKITQP